MKKKKSSKYRRKTVFQFLIMIPLLGLFLSTLSYWREGLGYKKETEELKLRLEETLEKEDELKSQISKLQNPEYIAKYAREKYLFSKNGEIIIRIED